MSPEASPSPVTPSGDATGSPPPEPALTARLEAAAGGDREALDALFQQVYEELRRLAHRVRAGQMGETLHTTALVHEAYLKLAGSAGVDWRGRAHFFALAARAMRQILVDAARGRTRAKRGGGDSWTVTLEEGEHATPVRAADLLALDEALERLAALDTRQALLVEHRSFAGLTMEETAEVLGISVRTAHREWRLARAWLRQAMRAQGEAGGP